MPRLLLLLCILRAVLEVATAARLMCAAVYNISLYITLLFVSLAWHDSMIRIQKVIFYRFILGLDLK
jgi:hypothetical protein